MSLSPMDIREPAPKLRRFVSCDLSNVVTWINFEVVVWAARTCCSGTKGIGPRWYGIKSFCQGPTECVLLSNCELFYPPDEVIWKPYLDDTSWNDLKVKFVQLSSCKDVTLDVVDYVTAIQKKWGI